MKNFNESNYDPDNKKRLSNLNFDDLTLKDAKHIFTEMQKHQLELENQNDVLHKKHSELELALEKYSKLINNASAGIITLNQKSTIIEINKSAANYFGEDADLLIDQKLSSFILSEDLNIFDLNLKLAFETEEQQTFDIRLFQKNNEVCWTQIKFVIISNSNGTKLCNAIINVKDNRKRTEAALKESIMQWQKIFNGIADSICLLDYEGLILQANTKTEDLLKIPVSEFVGHLYYNIIHALDQAIPNCPFPKVKVTKKRETLVIQFKDRWMEIIVDPLLNSQGEMVGAVHIMSDVTDRFLVGDALKESEEKFKTIFEESQDGILIADIDTNQFISANNSICNMLGYPSNEIICIGLKDIFINTEIVDSINQNEKYRTNGVRKIINTGIKRKDNSIFYADINSTYLNVKGKRYILSIFRDITCCIEIENELKEAKERLEFIFNAGPDAILITRMHDGYYIDSNEAFTKYTGYTREDLKGKSTLDINIWNDPSDREKLISELQEKGKCQNLETIIRNKNGTLRTIIMSVEVIPLNGIPHLLSISHDITEQKEIEALYLQSEDKYQLIADNTSDVILVLDIKNRKVSYVSPSIVNLTGYSVDDFLKLKWKEILVPESYRILVPDLLRRIKNIKNGDIYAKSKSYDIQIICKDKSIIWTELSTSFNIKENGDVDEMIGVDRNITERKVIQEKVKQNELRLKSSLKIAQKIFESDQDLLNFALEEATKLTLSKFGYFYSYNEELKEFTLLAWSCDNMKDNSNFPPQTTYKLENTCLWGEVIHQRKSIIDNDFKSPKLIKKVFPEGHAPINRFLSVPVIINKKIEGVIGVANKDSDYNDNDIDHLTLLMEEVWNVLQKRNLEKQVKLKNEELQELIATKDRFFSIVAHDLKNPFNIIIGFSELMMNSNGNLAVENLQKYASYIHTSSKQAYNLLINLLEWSSSERGLMQFNPELFEIIPFIDETLKVLKTNSDDKKIEITKNISPTLQVYADKNMLGIILRNLISNAIKYTHVKGHIEINVSETKTKYKFSIIDNGTGIKQEDIDKLFQSKIQHTTNGTNSEKGTGLGLLLCKDFVEKHHGQIWVESEFGKGSTFNFTIPKINQQGNN